MLKKKLLAFATLLVALAMIGVSVQTAKALITGGTGNKPVADPGWPSGAAPIFNNPGRIAWWSGPPFGGGNWVAECRGNARDLTVVLVEFAKLDVKNKRVVVHDGVGNSSWINPNREAAKIPDAKFDWSFSVWQTDVWKQMRNMPADINPISPADAENGPPAVIEVYAGGNVRWSDVRISKELTIVDERLEAHGFTAADGVVLEGTIYDLATNKPVAGRMKLQSVEAQKTGGYQYPEAAKVAANAQGKWVLKKTPAGWFRVVIEADGYVPRVAGYAKFDDQPRWQQFKCGLSKSAPVSGRVIDDAGQPLAGVEVQIRNVMTDSGRYESVGENSVKTGADGKFRVEQIPSGRATVWVSKKGYTGPGLGLEVATPKDGIELRMNKATSVRVSVDFTGAERPQGYIVEIIPEGGEAVGKWSGSGNIDAKNQINFENVPPGKYTLKGRPNPSNGKDASKPVVAVLKGEALLEVKLSGIPAETPASKPKVKEEKAEEF